MKPPLDALAAIAFIAAWLPVADAQPRPGQPPAVTAVLKGLADRTQQYYDRFVSIICTETVDQQDLKFNLAPTGKARRSVYELSVSRDPNARDGDDFIVERNLLSVNGRPVRGRQEPGCTDPKTGTPEPLGFLLEKNQSRFRFSLSEQADGGPAGTRALDFVQTPPDGLQIRWKGNCFEAEGGGQEGQIWFDPETFDVLQIDARLAKPFLVPVPGGFHGAQPAIRVERSEVSMRFSRVDFENPDETALLLKSIDTLTVFRGVPSLRTQQKLTNFRRFLSESTIRDSPPQAHVLSFDGLVLAAVVPE